MRKQPFRYELPLTLLRLYALAWSKTANVRGVFRALLDHDPSEVLHRLGFKRGTAIRYPPIITTPGPHHTVQIKTADVVAVNQQHTSHEFTHKDPAPEREAERFAWAIQEPTQSSGDPLDISFEWTSEDTSASTDEEQAKLRDLWPVPPERL